MQDEVKNMKIDNISFERVEDFQHSGTTLTNPNFIQVEIKSRLKSGNACYNIIRCRIICLPVLLSKNLKIKIYSTIFLPFVLYGFEIWSLTLRETRRLNVFENRVLRRIFGPKKIK